MAVYRVTFMNHIVETYLVEAESEEAAWQTDPGEYEDEEPEDWDCTMCEVVDVVLDDEHIPPKPLLVVRPPAE